MRLKTLKKVLKLTKFSHWSDYLVTLILLALVASIVSVLVMRYNFQNLIITDIRSPVRMTQAVYKLGETLEGEFLGEVFYSHDGDITRTLVCDRQSVQLQPFENRSRPTVLRGKPVGIIQLDRQATKAGVDIKTDKNCIITFRSIYCETFFTIKACNSNSKYYTNNFDIIE